MNCIRCKRLTGRNPRKNSATDPIPFFSLYCAPCVAVRIKERAAAGIVHGAIVERKQA